MSLSSRAMQPGDYATTDFNGFGTVTRVQVVERREQRGSQCGIQFRVTPSLRNGNSESWYDAEWFEPLPANYAIAAPGDYSGGLAVVAAASEADAIADASAIDCVVRSGEIAIRSQR